MRTAAPAPSGDLSRRAFMRAAGGVLLAAASLPVAAACAPAPPAAPTSSTPSTAGKVPLPTYAALENLPSPDLPGTPDGLLAPGYQRYPTNLIKSVPQPPGKGGEVNALTVSLSPAPTPWTTTPPGSRSTPSWARASISRPSPRPTIPRASTQSWPVPTCPTSSPPSSRPPCPTWRIFWARRAPT